MEILQNITLDFARGTMPITVFAKQFDKDTRKIEITPLNNGAPYTLDSGIIPRLQMTKPDKTTVINDATISGGKITATLTGQALTAAGTAVAEIGLYKGSTLLTSQTFYIEVERGAYDEDAVKSSDEYGALLTIIDAAEGAASDAVAAVSAARSAASSANSAAGNAATATTAANNAANSANSAAGSANTAANRANAAADSADTAADRVETAVANANAALANANAAVTAANTAVAKAEEITGDLADLLEEVRYGHIIE